MEGEREESLRTWYASLPSETPMAGRTPIGFEDRTFCFTGRMAELRRKDPEREVRARGGMTQGGVNRTLDDLVVDDVPSPRWRCGDFGSKIQAVLELEAAGARKPRIVSEGAFLVGLALTPPTNCGEIDSKIIVCTYSVSVDETRMPSRMELEALAGELAAIDDCFVRVKVFPANSFGYLFSEEGEVSFVETGWDIRVRITKVAGLAYEAASLAERIKDVAARWFDGGQLTVSEREEGSALFVRYLRDLPGALRVQYLNPRE